MMWSSHPGGCGSTKGSAGRGFGGHVNPKPLPGAGASPRGHGDCSCEQGPAVPGWAAPVGHSGLPPVLAQLGQEGLEGRAVRSSVRRAPRLGWGAGHGDASPGRSRIQMCPGVWAVGGIPWGT